MNTPAGQFPSLADESIFVAGAIDRGPASLLPLGSFHSSCEKSHASFVYGRFRSILHKLTNYYMMEKCSLPVVKYFHSVDVVIIFHH